MKLFLAVVINILLLGFIALVANPSTDILASLNGNPISKDIYLFIKDGETYTSFTISFQVMLVGFFSFLYYMVKD